MLRRISIVAAFAASACSADVVAIDLPTPNAMMRSMVVGFVHEGETRMFAFDLDEPVDAALLPNVENYVGKVRAYALFYNRPLERVNLAPGEVLAETEVAEQARFDNFTEGYVRDLPVDATWRGPEDGGPEIGADVDFWIRRRPPSVEHCPVEWEVRVHRLETSQKFSASVTVDDGLVHGFGEEGLVLAVTPEGPTPITTTATVPGPLSAARAPNGDLWIGTTLGHLYRGDLDRGFTLTATYAAPIRRIATPDVPMGPDELFATTNRGHIIRRVGGDEEVIDDFLGGVTRPSDSGIVWRGSDDVTLFLNDTFYSLLRGRLAATITDETNIGSFVATTKVEDGRVIVVAKRGAILTPFPETGEVTGLSKVGEHPTVQDVTTMIGYHRGFLYAPIGLALVYGLVSESGLCRPFEQNLVDFTAYSIQRMGDHFVVFGSADKNTGVIDNRSVVIVGRALFPDS